MKKLQEKTINFKELYKQYFRLDHNLLQWGDTAFEDLESAKDLINSAKEGSTRDAQKAILYLHRVVFKMAAYYFWVFLGPNPKSRQIRIENDAFYDYAGLCTEAMYKALKTFDPDKADTVAKLKGGLQFYFKGYIKAATEKYNKDYNSHGINGYSPEDEGEELNVISPDSFESDGNKSAWDSLGTENPYDNILEDDSSEFRASWKKLCNDPVFHGKKPWAGMMAMILKGASVEDVAKEYGVAKNTVREKFYSTKHNRENGSDGLISDLIKKYNISLEDLSNAMRDDMAFLINTLTK